MNRIYNIYLAKAIAGCLSNAYTVKQMDIVSLKRIFEAQSEPAVAILAACHSRIIENGQKGGMWVELVA